MNIVEHLDIKLALAISVGLIIFGLWYNDAVARWQRQDDGIYTAVYVVGGVLVTLIGASFIVGFGNFVVLLVLFVCSGAPMLIGSMTRHRKDAARQKRKLKMQAEQVIEDARKS